MPVELIAIVIVLSMALFVVVANATVRIKDWLLIRRLRKDRDA